MIAFEVGSHSPWISRFLKELGHRVIVANPRKLRAIYQNTRKSDEQDARILAKIARVDESLLYPIMHSSEKTLRDITGVGLLTSLAFVLTVEDPERFAKSPEKRRGGSK